MKGKNRLRKFVNVRALSEIVDFGRQNQKKRKEFQILSIENPVECTVVRRINRFVLKIRVKGNYYKAYLNNTGRLHEFLAKGRKGFCVRNEKGGKTDYRLFSIKEGNLGAIVDTQLQMKAFEKSLEMKLIPWLKGCKILKRNAKLGKSLIDYLLKCKGKEVYLEVKSAVLRQGHHAMYPDCPSSRGRKHIKELINHVKEGGKAVILFIAALPKAEAFKPNKSRDPELYELLVEAHKQGVKIKSMGMFYNPGDSFVYLFNPDLRINLSPKPLSDTRKTLYAIDELMDKKRRMYKMIKVGVYLPVYGGWFPSRGSGKARADGTYFSGDEKEEPPTYVYVKQVALEAERIGIDSLWIPDHMLNPIKGDRAPSLESWTLAIAIAEANKRVIIAHTTLCEAFRYPAVLAKQAATLSDISRGRFWLSIGAGWFKREYKAYGLPFYKHDDRVDRAKEAIQIIKRLWGEDRVTYSGKYYSISNGILEPKPDPMPPIWYAGMSEASRNLVAEEVDGWLMRGCTLEEAQKNIANMQERLKKKGRSKIEFAIPGLTFIGNTDEEAKKCVEQITGGRNYVLDRTLDTGLVGSPETIAQKIKQLERIGINHVLLQLTPTLTALQEVKKVLDVLGKINPDHC